MNATQTREEVTASLLKEIDNVSFAKGTGVIDRTQAWLDSLDDERLHKLAEFFADWGNLKNHERIFCQRAMIWLAADRTHCTYDLLMMHKAFTGPLALSGDHYDEMFSENLVIGLQDAPGVFLDLSTEEKYQQIFAQMYFAFELSMTDLEITEDQHSKEHKRSYIAYRDENLKEFIGNNHPHVRTLVEYAKARNSVDVEVLRMVLLEIGNGSTPLSLGIL